MSDSSASVAVLEQHPAEDAQPVINDLTIHVATINGSGSQSSNNVMMRSLFQMGIPVSGKNMFPSNIAGLPTWFTIRANKDGWTGRKKEVDLLVAMNPATAREDVMALDPGRICVYDAPLNCKSMRDDLAFYEVPFAKIAGELSDDSRLRKLLANMVYVGIVAELIALRHGASGLGHMRSVDDPRLRTWLVESQRGGVVADDPGAPSLGAFDSAAFHGDDTS